MRKATQIPSQKPSFGEAKKAALARAMRQEGKTLQQIADELGYKSTGWVHTILSKN